MRPTHRNTHTYTNPYETIWHLILMMEDIGHTCSPFLPGRPGRPLIPASPWTRTLRTLCWTTKDCSSCHWAEQLIIHKYNNWIKAQESRNTQTASSFMLIIFSWSPTTFCLSQSHLLSFGTIASTSPLGSSVTLETQAFITDRRPLSGWRVKK